MQSKSVRGPFYKSRPATIFYCGECKQEMVEIKKNPSHCSTCSKTGHRVTFRCQKCKNEIVRFMQNPLESPPCYSCT